LFQDDLIGLGFAILASLIFYFFRARVKLVYGKANQSLNHISVPDPNDTNKSNTTEIYAEKFFLQNTGRKTATNVEFVLSDFPADVSVWQPRDVEYKKIQNGNCLIKIPQISPRELVIIDCVYLNQLAAFVASVKCAESVGKEVPFWTLQRYPNWLYWMIWLLLILGAAQGIQMLLTVVGAI